MADTDTPQHNGTFYPLLLIGTIKGQSVEQAIKLGIELDRPMAALSFGHNSLFIAQGTHWKSDLRSIHTVFKELMEGSWALSTSIIISKLLFQLMFCRSESADKLKNYLVDGSTFTFA